MKNIYYRLWADAIKAAIKTNKNNINIWKINLLLVFSITQGTNVLTVFFLLKTIFGININIFINIDFFSGKMIDAFLSAFISLYLPFIILNYFLIFHKNKYVAFIEKYKGFKVRGGIIFTLYFAISMMLLILPAIIAKLIF